VALFLIHVQFFQEIPNVDYAIDKESVTPSLQMARLPFIENQGQISSDAVKFYAKTFAGTVFVTEEDLTYLSIKKDQDSEKIIVIKERFDGGSLHPQGLQKSQSNVNYFIGPSPNWKTNVPTYDSITLGSVWVNIDVNLKSYTNNVEKIFIVHPQANPSDIRISLDGIERLDISDSGEMVVTTELGRIVLSKPFGYQLISGQKIEVDVSYTLSERTYGFSVLSYDPRYDVVIDPLIASTFIGGTSDDVGEGLGIDSSGNVYVVGYSFSADYPTTVGVYNDTNNGDYDAVVSKFNSSLSSLLASTFIGGTDSDFGTGIVLENNSTDVYITGYTFDGATDFPTTSGAFSETHSGSYDAFVSRLDNDLTSLLASTLIGGGGFDASHEIVLNGTSDVIITGLAEDDVLAFPTNATAYNSTHGGSDDAFVSIFDSDLSILLVSTFLGGINEDSANSLVLDSSGNVYVAGQTNSTTFPTVGGEYDTSQNGHDDGFVSKLNSDLSMLLASTFIGGGGRDHADDIALDSSGNVYITGHTEDAAIDLPTTSGAYDTTANGVDDIFISKFNSVLTSLVASTFLGGSDNEVGIGIVIDDSTNIYVTGHTASSTNFPITSGAFDTSYNGGSHDAYLAKFDSTLTKLFASTFLGGSGDEIGLDIKIDSSGNNYITGHTDSSGYPTTSGAYDTSFNSGLDSFVTKTDSCLSGSCVTIVPTGGSVTIEVPAGVPATFDLPSDTQLSVTPPVDANVTTTDTDAGQSPATLAFLGTIVDIAATTETGDPACTTGCTIKFTFTGAQASAQGLEPNQVVIYHDSNEDGSFESNEALATTVVGDDPFTATATASFTSKFAVGGVKALALAGISKSLGLFELDKCDPDGFASGQSLRVYSISYDRCINNKLQVLAYSTCGPISAEVTTKNGRYVLGISSNQPFLNEQEKKIALGSNISPELESFNILIKDKRDSFTDKIILNQCDAIKTYEQTTGYTSMQQGSLFGNSTQNSTQITPTNLVQKQNDPAIPSWIKSNAGWWSSGQISDDEFTRGIEYLIKQDIIRVPEFAKTETIQESKQIPNWVKTNSQWWVDDMISDSEFTKGLEYLIKVGIIRV